MKTQKIRMYTTQYCGDCYRAKSLLTQHAVAIEEINIEKTPGAADFVMRANQGKRRVPTFEVDGRTFSISPYDPEKLLRELGLQGGN